jgi:hypothetical protein
MRKSTWTPSIVPNHTDHNFYLVMDRFNPDTTIFHERVVEETDLETVISDMLNGQYCDPLRVLSFNPVEKWSEDVSEDVAREVQRRCDLNLMDVPSALQAFVDAHLGRERAEQLTLKLVG